MSQSPRPVNLERFQRARKLPEPVPSVPIEPVIEDENAVDERPPVRVLCVLPNASSVINGIQFVSVPAGMLSELIPAKIADGLARIAGYSVVEPLRSATGSDHSAEFDLKDDDDGSTGDV